MMHFAATSDRERRRNLSPEPSAVADLRVCGRHALLFDDDASAAFINSVDALLPWSAHPSLLLDRYDVRNLLTDLPPRRKSGAASLPPLESGVLESDLERERYQDLSEGDEGGDDDMGESRESSKSGAYGAVAFSYGNGLDTSNDPGVSETVGYRPPFSVPESLLPSLPPSEKLHQIMSRTALFVSKHGGQSEIILRVKQGDNPTFGFLMPDHNLHPYFRFLVDHPELLLADTDSANAQEAVQKADAMVVNTVSAGALSLLGSMYGNDEEEDRSQKVASDTKSLVLVEVSPAVSVSRSDSPDVQDHSAEITKKNEAATSLIGDRGKFLPPVKKSTSVEVLTSDVHGKKQVPEVPKTDVASTSSHQALASSILEDNLPILEPPNFLKGAVEKVVEFIVRNGKQFEAVLIEQDKPHGRFPFLLKSNPFHPYYLKVLQEEQESKTSGKSSKTRKHDPEGYSSGSKRTKETSKSKDADDSQTGRSIGRESAISGQSIVATDLDKKEKFKMVIGGPKKDTSDQSSKPVQRHCGMSVDAAAEIVLAATRGLRNQKSNIPMSRGSSMVENGAQSASNVIHQSKSIGSYSISPHGHDSHTKPNSDVESGKVPSGYASHMKTIGSGNVSVAKVMAKNAALAAADEADSSEACLTKEQKKKAERLRRAKMFAAMLKSDSHQGTGSIPRLSPPLSNSGLSSGKLAPLGNIPQVPAHPSTSVAEPVDAMYRELDGSIVLVDGDPSTMKLELQGKGSAEQSERSTEKQHLGSKTHDKDSSDHKHSRNKHRRKESSLYDEGDDSEESGEDSNRTRSRNKSREKHRSRSRKHDHEDLDEHKHSRKRNRHNGLSQHVGEDEDERHSSPKDRETESRHKSKHHRHSERRYRHLHESRAESTSRPEKHRTRSSSEREVDGDHPANCITTVDNDGTELPLNHPNNLEAPNNSHTVTEVSDDLRQKVRAMLLANM